MANFPIWDPSNPFEQSRSVGWNPDDPFGTKRQSALTTVPPLEREEADSVLGSLGKGALGGLSYIAGSLQKAFGGRAIRGLFGGHPEEILSLIPFSDTMGISNKANEVRGEDLAKQWGWIGENDPNAWEWRDFVGPAVEIGLDPLVWSSFGTGALTAAGRAARAAGTLEKTAAGRIAAGQGGLWGLGVPMRDPSLVLGRGPLAQKIAGGLDWAWDKALYSAPGRYVSSLFDSTTKLGQNTARSAIAQREARRINALLPGRQAEELSQMVGIGRPLEEAGVLGQGAELRAQLEGTASALDPAVRDAAAKIRAINQQNILEEQILGRPAREFADKGAITGNPYSLYGTRYRTALPVEGQAAAESYQGTSSQLLSPRQGSNTARLDPHRGIVGGTGGLNEFYQDPLARLAAPRGPGLATDLQSAAQHIRENYLGEWNALGGDARYQALRGIGKANMTQAEAAEFAALRQQIGQSNKLALIARDADPQRVVKGLDYFANHPLQDFGTYGLEKARADLMTEAIYNILAKNADPALAATGVPLRTALKQIGLRNFGPGKTIGANTQMLDALVAAGKGTRNLADLKGFGVSEKALQELIGLQQGFSAPAVLRPAIGAWDTLTNLTRAMQTSLWPAFHTRNALTGGFMNVVGGARDPRYGWWNPMGYIRPFLDARKLRAAQAVPGAAEIPFIARANPGISDLDATQVLADQLFAQQARVGGTATDVGQVLGRGGYGQPGLVGDMKLPFSGPDKTVGQSLGEFFTTPFQGKAAPPQWWNPLAMRGVGGRTTDAFWWGKAGKEAGTTVDDLNRISAFIAKARQGYEPGAAAAASKAAHYDYCVDEDTEVLTKRGWLRYDAILPGDMTLGIDPNTRRIVWTPITEVNVFPSSGHLNRWHSTMFDALTTDNHRWLADGRAGRGGHWTLRTMPATHFVTTEMVREGPKKRLIVAGGETLDQIEQPVYTDEFVELIGWVITEGQYHIQTPAGVMVSQSSEHNPDYVQRIRDLAAYFSEQGATATEHTPRDIGWGLIHTFYFGEGIGELIRAVAPDKQLTYEFLTQLLPHQLQLLHQTLMDGDGTRSGGKKVWSQKNPARVDAFQALSAMIGIRSNARLCQDGTFDVTCYQSSLLYTEGIRHERIAYDGKVWCPTTSTGTWMARTKGKTYWTGNSALTPFESNVMRRIVPFYNWSRKNIPYTINELMTKGGGGMSLAIRAADATRQHEGYLPDYLGEGTAIRMGKEADGTQRFLTQLGLPFEDAFNMLATGPDQTQRTLQRIGGNLNPLIKFPIEMMSGTQLYSGRDLDRLQGYTGNTLIDNAIANSPASRLGTTLRTLADTRKDLATKGLNFITPGRMSDIDMDKERATALEGLLRKTLEQNPRVRTFEDVWAKPEDVVNMSPEEQQLLQVWKTIQTLKKQNIAAARAAAGPKPPVVPTIPIR